MLTKRVFDIYPSMWYALSRRIMMDYTQTLTYETIDTTVEHWDELPTQIQADLIAWLNLEKVDDDDYARLIKLYVEGRFKAWYCPLCGDAAETRVFCADVNDDEWSYFQGSLNQDFAYFGDKDKYTPEYIQAMCDSCRCHG